MNKNLYLTTAVAIVIAICTVPLSTADYSTGYIAPPNPEPILIPTVEESYTGYIAPPPRDGINLLETQIMNTNIITSTEVLNPNIYYNGDYNPICAYSMGYGYHRLGGTIGHCARFYRPSGGGEFIIKQIGIYSLGYGIDGYSRIQIRYGKYVVYSKVIARSEYSSETPGWNYIDIPNVPVTGEFFIEIYTGSDKDDGVFIYLDNNMVDTVSAMQIDSEYHLYNYDCSDWDFIEPQNEVNWMISVTDIADNPEYDEGYTDGHTDGYTDGYTDGHADGIADAILNEVIGDVTGNGVVNIGDAVLLFNWVSFPNERGTTYVLK